MGAPCHVDRHLRQRYVCGYPGRRHSEIPIRTGNSPIALEIAITARENRTARTMIDLEDIFLDPVNREMAESLRREAADRHASRPERGYGRWPLRNPAVDHSRVRSRRNRRQKEMLAKQTKEARTVIHSVLGVANDLGKCFGVDAALRMKLLVDSRRRLPRLLSVIGAVPAGGLNRADRQRLLAGVHGLERQAQGIWGLILS